ncbi:MAG: MATE family efflux transporter [Coriobacteriales bacterium]|jgi:putative MATE family efflux protein|nr:MATE family efflux transporter [Coriobacteriales bacterium]
MPEEDRPKGTQGEGRPSGAGAAQPPVAEQSPVAEQPPVAEQESPAAEQSPVAAQPPVAEQESPAAAQPPDADERARRNDEQMRRNEERMNRLGTASIPRLILEFSIPSIIGLVVNGLYNFIDTIFLGHGVGAAGIAVGTVAMPFMVIGMAISLLVGQGGNALAALRLGEGKREEAERILGNTFTLCIIFCVISMALLFGFLDPILVISGATPDIWDHSKNFMMILGAGFIFQFLGMAFNNFIRTAGDPNRALWTMVAGTLACIVFNWLFVLVFQWGVEGSALATIIGQALSCVLVMWFFVFSKRSPLKLHRNTLRLNLPLSRAILALGTAPFILQLTQAANAFVLNNLLVKYGMLATDIGASGALAAFGVVGRVGMFIFFPILGVAMAVQPIFGFNFGARKYERVRTTFIQSFVWVMVIGVFFWALVELFPAPIINIFGIEEYLVDFSVLGLRVQMFMMPIMGLQLVATSYFQSTGQPGKSTILALTRSVLYLTPLLFLAPVVMPMLFPGVTPLAALYYSYPLSDLLSVATAAWLMVIEARKVKQWIAERDATGAPRCVT